MSAVARLERSREPDRRRLACDLARQAVASLYDELVLYPKPGLVSLRDCGAHDDMDASTFLRSLFALRAYFRAIAGAGMRSVPFGELQALGVQAEARMLAATRGRLGEVPHRQAFRVPEREPDHHLPRAERGDDRRDPPVGHEQAVHEPDAGACADREQEGDDEGRPDAALRARVSGWRSSLRLSTLLAGTPSHGRLVALRYGVRGARGEAADGFPAVFECALPALRAALARGVDSREARIHTFFTLLASVTDTNLLHRGGRAGLAVVREGAAEFLALGSVFAAGWLARAENLHRRCSSLRLSPGGCADLMSAACFVHRVQSG